MVQPTLMLFVLTQYRHSMHAGITYPGFLGSLSQTYPLKICATPYLSGSVDMPPLSAGGSVRLDHTADQYIYIHIIKSNIIYISAVKNRTVQLYIHDFYM